MRGNLVKKGLVLGIILLFVGASVIPTIGGTIGKMSGRVYTEPIGVFNGDTIYVDDDNTNGPWDGTQDHPYQFIQDGVDNASPGDTVFVYSGVYSVNGDRVVEINKDIILWGENKETTIIDGKLDWPQGAWGIIILSSDNVGIIGLTIKNCNFGIKTGPLFSSEANEVGIVNCTITNNKFGIFVDDYQGLIIQNEVWIYNNVIHNNDIGIYVGNTNKKAGIDISFNKIIENNNCGILIEGGEEIKISHNNFTENDKGIYISVYQFEQKTIPSKNNYIDNNNFFKNDVHATFDCRKNSWSKNYWDNWIGIIGDSPILEYFPKVIIGKFSPKLPIPWFNFDINPSKEPYDFIP